MEKLMYFTTGGLSTLSISNLFSSVGVEWWLESLLSVVGGMASQAMGKAKRGVIGGGLLPWIEGRSAYWCFSLLVWW